MTRKLPLQNNYNHPVSSFAAVATTTTTTTTTASNTSAAVTGPMNGMLPYSQHQPKLSVNSVQSIIEPVTPPPIGQKNNKRNHQKAQSLDLSGFDEFISSTSSNPHVQQSPFLLVNSKGNQLPQQSYMPMLVSSNKQTLGIESVSSTALPLINEFDHTVPTTIPPLTGSAATVPLVQNKKFALSTSPSFTSAAKANTASNTAMSELSELPLEELNYVGLATDQFGCRFLQKKLESPTESNTVRDLLYAQSQHCFVNLIIDPFGNYLVQKLCEYLTKEQKTMLLQSIYPHLFQISANQYGTRSLQKIIGSIDDGDEQQIDLIVKGFSPEFTSIDQIVTLINDLNGNHVIQKCIFKFPATKFGFIINAIIAEDNIVKISTHKHGCCVLQKLLSVCTLQQTFKISVNIVEYLPGLINDQFGNYIIQFILDIKELDFYLVNEVFKRLANRFCQLSCLKFSSNVIEKFIKKLFVTLVKANKNHNAADNKPLDINIIGASMNILMAILNIFTTNLSVLIKDNYGNYTLQTLLDVKNYSKLLDCPQNRDSLLKSNMHKFSQDFTASITNLVAITKSLLPSIKTTPYAKKIKLKVNAFIELTGIDLNPPNVPTIAEKPLPHEIDFDSKNREKFIKNHSRHYSLPVNAYQHSQTEPNNFFTNNSVFNNNFPMQSQDLTLSAQLKSNIPLGYIANLQEQTTIMQSPKYDQLSAPFNPHNTSALGQNVQPYLPNHLQYQSNILNQGNNTKRVISDPFKEYPSVESNSYDLRSYLGNSIVPLTTESAFNSNTMNTNAFPFH